LKSHTVILTIYLYNHYDPDDLSFLKSKNAKKKRREINKKKGQKRASSE